MRGSSTKREFWRAVWARWKLTVTGSHSAPFLLLGVLATVVITIVSARSSNNLSLVIVLSLIVPSVLALSSLIISFHAVWDDERKARIAAEEKLKPGALKLSFNGDCLMTNDPPGPFRYVLLVTVQNETGQAVTNCVLQ